MKEKPDALQGTLALMVLKTLDVLGPQHGRGIARRIEQISGDLLAVNQGTLYPLLLRLEHEGAIASEWGASENNRRARFYRLPGPAESNSRRRPAYVTPSSRNGEMCRSSVPAIFFNSSCSRRSCSPFVARP